MCERRTSGLPADVGACVDLDEAERTLDVAATLSDYPFADEPRLDYNEPMERLRIAIARGGFATALDYADEAEANPGPRHFEGYPDHPPIKIPLRVFPG